MHGPPCLGLLQNLLIDNAGRNLSDIDDVMAVPAQTLHYRAVGPFIRDQVHSDLALTG
jgi:hypothetical protein